MEINNNCNSKVIKKKIYSEMVSKDYLLTYCEVELLKIKVSRAYLILKCLEL